MRFVARPVATVRVPPRVWRIPFPSIFFSFAGLELTFSGIKLVTTQPLIAAALRLLDSKRQQFSSRLITFLSPYKTQYLQLFQSWFYRTIVSAL